MGFLYRRASLLRAAGFSLCFALPAQAQLLPGWVPPQASVQSAVEAGSEQTLPVAPSAAPNAAFGLKLPDIPRFSVPTAHVFALMTSMRLGEAYLWPEPFARTDPLIIGGHYRDAYTRAPKWNSRARAFEWDGDAWYINVVGHQLFGSELYLRARSCGNPTWVAVGIAALASATWEYGFEASGVRPSALDLVYTPLSGMLLGEGRYWAHLLAGRIDNAAIRGILRALLDPLGDLERALGAEC